jgi:hypothetical protein
VYGSLDIDGRAARVPNLPLCHSGREISSRTCSETFASVLGRAGTGALSPNTRSRSLPTVLRSGPYRLYFVSHDLHEPPHVHVDRDDRSAKFWLAPVAVARNLGFTAVELRRVHRLVEDNAPRRLEAWDVYFRNQGR